MDGFNLPRFLLIGQLSQSWFETIDEFVGVPLDLFAPDLSVGLPLAAPVVFMQQRPSCGLCRSRRVGNALYSTDPLALIPEQIRLILVSEFHVSERLQRSMKVLLSIEALTTLSPVS